MKALTLEAVWYSVEAVEAGAAALAGRARVRVETSGGLHRVAVAPLGRGSAESLARELADEALEHELRAAVVALNRPLTGPALAHVFGAAFTAVPKDPLEEMDPATAAQRRAETEALLAEAGRGPARGRGKVRA